MLELGIKAPDFELPDQNGEMHKLSDYAGKKVILYFYPKDNTAGCTKQACGFSERYPQFTEKGAVILGVSKDSVASHKRFEEKYGLAFTLLADPERKVIEAYDVWKEKKNYGKGIINNCKTKIILNMEDEEAQRVKTILRLSETEVMNITHFQRGNGLISTNNNNITVEFKASNLEKEFDVVLFNRTSPLTLTYAGQALKTRARELLDLRDETYKEISDIKDFSTGQLSIGVSHTRGRFILPEILPTYQREFPGIELHLAEGNSSELANDLLHGNIDLMIDLLPFTAENVATVPICQEEIKTILANMVKPRLY